METGMNPERQSLLDALNIDHAIVSGRGCHVRDAEGRDYVDFIAQYGALPLGHAPDRLWDAVERFRTAGSPTLLQPFRARHAEALAERLLGLLPDNLRWVTFANSGAEAVEAAFKLARGRTQKRTIVSARNAFHGKTHAAVAATASPVYRKPFMHDGDGHDYVPFNDLAALEERLARRDVAAVILEPVQGEGGMIPAEPGYLAGVEAACRKHGALFILDEVQTGLGRTGRLFALEEDGVRPDILCLAKALGGGLVSLGACIASDEAWSSSFGYFHSSTFANNNLSAAVGLALIDALTADDGALLAHAATMGERLRARLDALVGIYPDVFQAVTGRGLMQAVHLAPLDDPESLVVNFMNDGGSSALVVCAFLMHAHGVITMTPLSSTGRLRIEPPLIVEEADIDRLIAGLVDYAEMVRAGDLATLMRVCYAPEELRPDRRPALVAGSAPVRTRRVPAAANGNGANGEGRSHGRYAFLIHPTEFADLAGNAPRGLADLAEPHRASWNAFLAAIGEQRMEPFDPGIALDCPRIESATGVADGHLIATMMLPEAMMALTPRERKRLVADFADIALDLEVDMLGLGAFTSIITRNGQDLADLPFGVTTGNSLTAMAGSEAVRLAGLRHGIDPAETKTGVVGASGSVGRIVCRHLANDCGAITLFGNPDNPNAVAALEGLAGSIYRQLLAGDATATGPIAEAVRAAAGRSEEVRRLAAEPAKPAVLRALWREVNATVARENRPVGTIEVSVDPDAGLPEMDFVVSATNAKGSVLTPERFKPGAVVCDIARPPDVAGATAEARRDVHFYEAGVMRLPGDIAFGRHNIVGLPRGVGLACHSETIVLTLSGVRSNFNLGSEIAYDQAVWVRDRAVEHGFGTALVDVRSHEVLAMERGEA
ncbi:MAG: aminotransferase class III-fold pyridoxal phosphate-dependent enzyme [Azospirillaceae bacterium]